ncbi:MULTISPECIES: tRNA (adenosine(37)-N6)-threonylcarbamoyltransferase complex dimerization subunit type 1 TsaB [Sphingobium]|uniref:tRNA (adenosine(37)-N6)-threonylcarbamoyltransferase complex dimerization subunit type 1 TsaB n=1 Tax=Sphingobium TaxID=165695 RepID=UPI000DBB7D25|nr:MULTISPECIES: tRNA (adenosine(37)-N6)-threonylcarbamoyltransferase complex dimerization subunit type 1 TsaB [Sphingobium]KAA9018551.1 tRNA (adenosine(37)-N6)-threonylcarbamoyltransferase complex dimerization subunit type 1 TsaB [Sphingobium limneticum]MBU0933748.1 tRNA (adenosine(37)-N6)-threonylcarbamoyltransferase complex dimerization subunit type 1 TsaB [Alphaproteobacteria bacterium]BBC99697.1 tRNA threonylcarbamoyladenosine biosynthesis protein TsaB [Sphingobium sp. YG1]
MRLLVIDTATQALSVALLENGAPIGRFHEVVGRGHAEALLPAIAALPDGGRADAIAVDVGPGSFTGVRIGIAAARALALAWSIPLHGYGAPALIAAKAAQTHPGGPIAVTITGGHGELFWQYFTADGLQPTSAIASTPIAELAATLDDANFYGTGAEALVTARGKGSAISLYPDAADYGLIAGLTPLPPSPIYGRGADAKTMAERAAS